MKKVFFANDDSTSAIIKDHELESILGGRSNADSARQDSCYYRAIIVTP